MNIEHYMHYIQDRTLDLPRDIQHILANSQSTTRTSFPDIVDQFDRDASSHFIKQQLTL